MTDDSDVSPPPAVGELLPRAAEAFGVRVKLETYSLNPTHKYGGGKARGFELILGITIDAIDYLEAQILARVLDTPIRDIRDNQPYGANYVVNIQVPGIGAKADRVINVRTVWTFDHPGAPPRLVTAIPRP
jgi:filamentous hemagglutinin